MFFEDQDVLKASRKEMAAVRREMQIVFQDPFSSLNPRMTVRTIVSEPLQIHGIFDKMGGIRYINELLERVGLSPDSAGRYPHEFSGGQRQRIGLARALAPRPKLIICDEPVSALDVSVQAQIINLLEDLQNEFGLTYLFVAHDLSVVRHISDRVVVMYLGKVMEVADRLPLYETPMHPYTQALLSAVPIPDPQVERARERIILRGDVPSPLNPPTGCVFHPRCFLAERMGAEGADETVVVGKLAPRAGPKVCVDVVPEPEEHATRPPGRLPLRPGQEGDLMSLRQLLCGGDYGGVVLVPSRRIGAGTPSPEPAEEAECQAGELCGSGDREDQARKQQPGRRSSDPPGNYTRSLTTLGLIAAVVWGLPFHRPDRPEPLPAEPEEA